MPANSRPHKRFSDSSTRTFALLAATTVLVALLALEAVSTARAHRATAEGVLRDYARFAAEQYASNALREIEFYGLYPIFRVLHEATTNATPLPSLTALHADAPNSLAQSLRMVRYLYRLDRATGTAEVIGDSSGAFTAALQADLLRHVETAYDTSWGTALYQPREDHRGRVFAYDVANDGPDGSGHTAVIGIEVDRATLDGYLRGALERGPLLPTSLTGVASTDSLLAMRVMDARGEPFLQLTGARESPRSAYDPVTITYPLGERVAGFQIAVRLQPGIVESLIIGGLPRGRVLVSATLGLMVIGLLAATILQMRRERELARLRTEFVSNVSHELRTPLAQIRMFAETLLLGRMRTQDEEGRSLAIIDKEARRLTTLVENVLHFSRQEAQTVHLNTEATALAPFLQDVVESFEPLARAARVRFDLRLSPVTGTIDPGAVRQIVLNLLDNAVKYGPRGQTIRVSLERLGNDAVIAVEDEGPGIPRAQRHLVWERFSRLGRDRESVVAGAGIGLAVVRELTELHGGRVTIEDGEVGSRFVVSLPLPLPDTDGTATHVAADGTRG